MGAEQGQWGPYLKGNGGLNRGRGFGVDLAWIWRGFGVDFYPIGHLAPKLPIG